MLVGPDMSGCDGAEANWLVFRDVGWCLAALGLPTRSTKSHSSTKSRQVDSKVTGVKYEIRAAMNSEGEPVDVCICLTALDMDTLVDQSGYTMGGAQIRFSTRCLAIRKCLD